MKKMEWMEVLVVVAELVDIEGEVTEEVATLVSLDETPIEEASEAAAPEIVEVEVNEELVEEAPIPVRLN